MTNRQRGDRAEYKTRDKLQSEGYAVTRSAGSFGIFDMIAIPQDDRPLRCIQIKAFKPTTKKELKQGKKPRKLYLKSTIEEIKQFKVPSYATKEIWKWIDRVKEPEIDVIKDAIIFTPDKGARIFIDE